MDVKMGAIVMSFSLLEAIVFGKSMEYNGQEHHNIPKEACDSMLVSHEGATEGKVTFL